MFSWFADVSHFLLVTFYRKTMCCFLRLDSHRYLVGYVLPNLLSFKSALKGPDQTIENAVTIAQWHTALVTDTKAHIITAGCDFRLLSEYQPANSFSPWIFQLRFNALKSTGWHNQRRTAQRRPFNYIQLSWCTHCVRCATGLSAVAQHSFDQSGPVCL